MGDTLATMATEISRRQTNFKMWDKGQMVVILSRTRRARDTIFVGNQEESINALADLLLVRTQWTDYIEHILSFITITNHNDNSTSTTHETRHMPYINNSTFPYRICDTPLPECNTGYVYMILSLQNKSFVYIGKTFSI